MKEISDRDEVSGPPATMPIDYLPQPVILVTEGRLLVAANAKAVEIFGQVYVNKDLSTMIRHPLFLDITTQVLDEGVAQECEVVVMGRRRRTFHASINPNEIDGKRGGFIALFETTAASEAERMRSAFVADVSHELRSPLTTLIATVETLKGRAGANEETRNRFMDLMAHETGRMHRIVDDLLSLSATEAHEHILPDETVELRLIVRHIREELGEKARGKTMALICNLGDEDLNIVGEYDEIYKALHNLVDNAVKYGAPGTTVTLLGQITAAKVSISIHNIGSTIPEEHIPRLTERFYRVDRSRSRDLGGTGLGLAIVKHIVNRHLGNFSVESSDEKGTSFKVSFPQKKSS
jgi:two-component system phosphate regulon sensor histidine kinase PhoR